MLECKGEEGNRMILSSYDLVLANNLKGRISKALNTHRVLRKDERKILENLFLIIDKIILYKGDDSKKAGEEYKKALIDQMSKIDLSKKGYTQEHILPAFNKIISNDWSTK